MTAMTVTIDLDSGTNVNVIKNGETIKFEEYISRLVDKRFNYLYSVEQTNIDSKFNSILEVLDNMVRTMTLL